MLKSVPIPSRPLLPCLLLILALPSIGCSPEADNSPVIAQAADSEEALQPGWRQDRQALGKATYEAVCTSCHERGEGDAPRTGVREDWEDRSGMWEAVLFNHAKAGYLEMPERGGHPELSDEAVEAAAEYMLDVTFPELPKD